MCPRWWEFFHQQYHIYFTPWKWIVWYDSVCRRVGFFALQSATQLLLHVHPDWVKTQNEAAKTMHCKFLFEMLLPSVAFIPSSNPIFSLPVSYIHLFPGKTPVPDIHISQGLHSNLDRAGVRKGDDSHPVLRKTASLPGTLNSSDFHKNIQPALVFFCDNFQFSNYLSLQILPNLHSQNVGSTFSR